MSVVLPITIAIKSAPHGLMGWLRTHWPWHPRVEVLDRWILVFAVFAPFTNIPQLLKVYVEHSADLSILSWSLYALFNIPMFCHGIIRKDAIVVFNTSLNAVLQILMIVGIVLYG